MSETELTKARERNVVARFRDVARRIATNNTPQPAALTAKTISDLVDLLESCLDERDAAATALQQALAERDEARADFTTLQATLVAAAIRQRQGERS